ncbi:glycolate oxidase [Methylohalomonas lacus]|uniref:Glycolate oxidase n=1 Tax=Methylohalomonas lacus TaxID=398773 RepID=A0AAE3L4X6_9GAMM|nr:FAD-linked oxidase C-terminal domain-containing protein [Methylohalomonas lacus]MCS3902322.1 glycolate oxidase [Methylohalomonas lacus]
MNATAPHGNTTAAAGARLGEVIAALETLLPAESVIVDTEPRRVYECDGLSAYRQLPGCVVLPNTIAQVQAVLRLCHEHRVPVVARGAGTGLSGGALPIAEGVLLSLAKFSDILEIDPLARTARVQPGVRNISISEAVAEFGLFYAPDPSSQIACTIGGNVAENSGGVHCLKYGLTVHNVLGIKFITSDGELIELGGQTLDSPGLDLLALFNGSEGMLGVIVEITVKLLPQPPVTEVLLAAFDDVGAAGNAVAAIIAAGIIPAGLEMMDQGITRAAEDFVHAGYPRDAAAILLCELDGIAEETRAQLQAVEQILRDAGASDIRVAADAAARARFWAGRKAAFPASGRIAPDYYCMDGTIPRKCIAEVLERISALAREHELEVVNVFHAGDGNLHPLVLYDVSQPGELERAEQLGGRILEACVAAGGTVTGEHGVGVEKINQMCVQFSSAELTQFHAVKAAFDEHGLLNPGKAVPTLNRCAEFGRMHVHHGQISHPELERF